MSGCCFFSPRISRITGIIFDYELDGFDEFSSFLSRKMRKGRKSCLRGHAESAEIRRKGLLLNVFFLSPLLGGERGLQGFRCAPSLPKLFRPFGT